MENREFIKEILEIVAQVEPGDLKDYFDDVKKSIESSEIENKEAALNLVNAIENTVIANRKAH